jgi:hypothetical protein
MVSINVLPGAPTIQSQVNSGGSFSFYDFPNVPFSNPLADKN